MGSVGRRRPRARLAVAFLYGLLALGAMTTLYPFLAMVTTGFKGPTDQNDNRLVPAFWVNSEALYQKYVDDKYAGNLEVIAATRSTQKGPSGTGDLPQIYRDFLMTLPLDCFQVGFRQNPSGVTSRLNLRYQAWLRGRFATIELLNHAYLEEDTSFATVSPPTEAYDRPNWKPSPLGSKSGRKWADWQGFKASLPAEFRLPLTERAQYQGYIKSKYHYAFSAVPAAVRQGALKFEQLELPASGDVRRDFEAHGRPNRTSGAAVEARWVRFQHAKGIAAKSTSGGDTGQLPIEASERDWVSHHSGAIAREFSTRNYRYVASYLALNSQALTTTVLYCFLAIISTLGINGIAAYALSRYPIRASARLLIFLLATMAFPTEVTMIPNFLLLKNLHLLNTYTALVLPGAASGLMIFMLKGFFDSLPQELFEAAAIDGAPELVMLWRVALPLSRPVFGYFALLTFVAAYGNFLYAFLVAQDRRMWTLMVFIYQLSGSAPKHVMMAAFTLAALPTLVVFLLAQRVITRGIVLPGER